MGRAGATRRVALLAGGKGSTSTVLPQEGRKGPPLQPRRWHRSAMRDPGKDRFLYVTVRWTTVFRTTAVFEFIVPVTVIVY